MQWLKSLLGGKQDEDGVRVISVRKLVGQIKHACAKGEAIPYIPALQAGEKVRCTSCGEIAYGDSFWSEDFDHSAGKLMITVKCPSCGKQATVVPWQPWKPGRA